MKPQRNAEVHSLALLLVIAVAISLSIGCVNLEWSCTSGECIAVEYLCDGNVNCADGSDETSDTCIHRACPPFSFRCLYGACVPEKARCNGITECADSSDEAQVLCEPDKERENTLCSQDQFQCLSGNCIEKDAACDGRAECPDQSDESVEACASNLCEQPYFRCGYGACIKAKQKCDGKLDCLDGSDETFNLCGVQPPTRPTLKPSISPAVTTTVSTQAVSHFKTSCTAPNIKNSRLVTEANPSIVIQPGEEVQNMISIIYECRSGYFREGPQFNLCFNGAWFSKIDPVCTVYCPHEILNGVTFRVMCMREGVTVPCNNRIKPGTIGQVSCPTKYRIPDYNPTQTLFCDESGHWDYSPFRCEPICGEDLVPSVPFLVNGQVTNITSVPWHVGIYKQFSDQYRHHCGGTLISAKVVISAAHCFWDNANAKLYDKSTYIVGAGKFFRDFYKEESRKAQFQNVSEIDVPMEYKGEEAKYKADIAVLVLTNPFILSEFVSPICIEWKKDGAKSITSGQYGQVAGWGKDETGDFSSELKTIHVPVSSYEVCRNEAGPQLADSVTSDKFCALNTFNTNACQGDSGGGFTIKKVVNGKNIHYLWGVVSTGVPVGLTCSNYHFVSYTNIQYYEGFVTTLETPNRPK